MEEDLGHKQKSQNQDLEMIISNSTSRDKTSLDLSVENLKILKNYIKTHGQSSTPEREESEIKLEPDFDGEKNLSNLVLSTTSIGNEIAKTSDKISESLNVMKESLAASHSAMSRMSRSNE